MTGHVTGRNDALRLMVVCLVIAASYVGCARKRPAIDPQPFQTAIAQYLELNSMAMTLKDIKQGPLVEGKTATLTASLTHASLGGPAVTWEFRFERNPDGTWKAVSHK